LPAPELPPFHIVSKLFGDAISIAIVTFALNISMAKFFAKKYKYEISPNQELFAYGTANILSSFFQGYPSSVSLSRSAILEATDARTQVNHLKQRHDFERSLSFIFTTLTSKVFIKLKFLLNLETHSTKYLSLFYQYLLLPLNFWFFCVLLETKMMINRYCW
jgi:hypothetical protein